MVLCSIFLLFAVFEVCVLLSEFRVCFSSIRLQTHAQVPKLSYKGSAWPPDLMLFYLESQNGKERGAQKELALLFLCANGKSGINSLCFWFLCAGFALIIQLSLC